MDNSRSAEALRLPKIACVIRSEDQGIFESGAQGLAMPRHRIQDTEPKEDWQRAALPSRASQIGERT